MNIQGKFLLVRVDPERVSRLESCYYLGGRAGKPPWSIIRRLSPP